MKTNAFLFLIVLLMVSLGANFIQMRAAKEQQDYRKDETARFQEQTKKDMDEIRARDVHIQALLSDRKEDSLSHAKTQGGLKARIQALNRMAVKSKIAPPGVQQFLDTIAGVYYRREIFENGSWKDTVIYFQGQMIKDLENQRDTLYLTDNQAIDSLQANNELLQKKFREQWNRADKAEFVLDQEKGKDFIVGPGIGIDYRGRPTVSVNVTYRLWSFRLKKRE